MEQELNSTHLADGMTVAELCRAALTISDNTAVNLLLGLLGGPAAVTGFLRGLGDPVTRLDRTEPDLNVTTAGDVRDTSTPAQVAHDLNSLLVGGWLDPTGRTTLSGWMRSNQTGAAQIRAGTPAGWPVAVTFHQDRIRHMPDGQLFATITNGKSNMPPYAMQIKVDDRWSIVAYVRALQVAQPKLSAPAAAAPTAIPGATSHPAPGGTGAAPAPAGGHVEEKKP